MNALTLLVEGIADGLIRTSWHASILIAIVGAVQLGFRKQIAPRWRHALWLVVVARLLLPETLAWSWSPLRLLSVPVWLAPTGPPSEPTLTSSIVIAAAPRERTEMDKAKSSAGQTPPSGTTMSASSAVRRTSTPTWRFWLGLVWLCGSTVLLARLAFTLVRLRRQARAFTPLADKGMRNLLEACASRMGVRDAPALLTGCGIAAPALLSSIHPRIIFPRDLQAQISQADMRFVLLHELAHLKRRDVAVNWLFALLEIVHWLNPLVWWAFARAREEAELACDELAASQGGECGGVDLGHAILRLVEAVQNRPVAAGMAAGVHGSRRFLSRRIRELSRLDTSRKGWPVLPVLLLVGCIATGLTKAPDGIAPEAAPGSLGELVSRDYDVTPLHRDTNPDFPAPRLGVVIEAGADDKAREEEKSRATLEEAHARKIRELEARIRSAVPIESWNGGGRIEWSEDGGIATVVAPTAVQEKVRDLLEKLMAEHQLIVHLETRLLTLDSASVEALPRPLARTIEEALAEKNGTNHPRLAAEDVDRLVSLSSLSNLPVHRPSLTLLNHQVAHILVVSQSAMIADAKATTVDGEKKLEPVIGILNTGFTIQVQPSVHDSRTSIALDLKAQSVEKRGPSKVAFVEGVPIEMPELTCVELKASLDAPRGEWVLARAVKPENTVLLLVKAEIVEPERKE